MSRCAVVLVLGCIAAFLVSYGSRVIFDVPLLDDWSFVRELQRYLEGECSLPEYLFTRHNEHLTVPSRLAFLLLYHWAALDLRFLRWCSLAIFFACALIVTAAVWRDVARSSEVPSARGRATELLLWLPFAAMTTSLASWETIALAMTFTNAVALLATLSAVLAFERWRQRPSIGNRLATFGLALLATVSLGSGFLLFLVFAIAATGSFRFAHRRLETSLLWLLGLGLLCVQAMARPAGLQQSSDIWRLALAVAEVAGVPLVWQQQGQLDASLCRLFGAGLVVAILLATLHHVRSGAELRVRTAKYLLWGSAGLVTCTAIAWARYRLAGIEIVAASRYVAMVLPLALGAYGYWICTPAIRTAARHAACVVALATTCLILATDYSEYRMGFYRARTYTGMIEILSGDVAKVPEATWRTQLYLERWLADQVVQEIVPFLREKKLSLFRSLRGQ